MLAKLLWGESPKLILATACSLALGIVTTFLFALIGPALQTVQSGPGTELVFTELLGPYLGHFVAYCFGSPAMTGGMLWNFLPQLIVGLALARAILSATQWYTWEKTSEKIAAAIRSGLVRSYLKMHPRICFEKQGFDSSISSTLTTDVKYLREYIVHFYGGLPRELIQVILYLITAASLSPKLFGVFFLGVIPAVAVLSRLGKKIRRRSGQALDTYGDLSEWLQQRLLGIETIKHYKTETIEYSKVDHQTEHLNRKFLKTIRVKARTNPLLEILAVSALVVVIYLALDLVLSKQVTASVMMSFFGILGIMVQSASKLGRYYNSNKEGAAALDRIEAFSRLADDYERKTHADAPNHHESTDAYLMVNRLSLTYPGQQVEALKEISYTFQRGKIYCLVGPSGAGKSSLMSVLLGLVEPSQGSVSLCSSIIPGDIGYLPQDVLLAPVSIAANIAYPDLEIDRQRLHAALASARLSGVFDEQQIFADVEDDSHGLSGGQKQRIMLARLFYHRCPLVFIDEGTSAIDPENEKAILEAIQDLARQGTTVIMIAHRQSAIGIANDVVKIEAGRLATV